MTCGPVDNRLACSTTAFATGTTAMYPRAHWPRVCPCRKESVTSEYDLPVCERRTAVSINPTPPRRLSGTQPAARQDRRRAAAQLLAGQPAALPAEFRAAASVAVSFIDTAVCRSHTGRSYPLVTASLRQGQTRSQWARGNIAVVPVANAVVEQASRSVYRPARHPTVIAWLVVVSGSSFWIELVKQERWRVDYWAPALPAAWLSPTLRPPEPHSPLAGARPGSADTRRGSGACIAPRRVRGR